MTRYDPYTDSFIPDDIDLRSYMLGYLQGCEDSYKKYNELTRINLAVEIDEETYNRYLRYQKDSDHI